MQKFMLTADGDYLVNRKHKDSSSAIYTYGVLGAATAVLQYKDITGSFKPFKDGLLVIDDQTLLDHGSEVEVYVTVTGSDGSTAIGITCAGID